MALTVLPRVVSKVRRFIEGFVAESAERMGTPLSLADRVAMTAHELLENVAKYAEDRHGVLRLVSRSEEGGRRRLIVSVSNNTSLLHIERIKAIFRELAEAEDPMAHYLTLLRRKTGQDESGLGLARIRAECGMLLSLSVDQQQVRVSATSEIFEPATGERR
jgi:anti-sigma regulatory factor (Ser/Thr protein kinase)